MIAKQPKGLVIDRLAETTHHSSPAEKMVVVVVPFADVACPILL
jgi:hypothetical protein